MSLLRKFKSSYTLLGRALRGEDQLDYTKGPLNRAIVFLAIPMVLEMAMESLFAIVDIFFVSRLGTEAVSAVGLTEATASILYALAIGLSMGVTAMVARRFGEGDHESASKVTAQSMLLGLAFGLGAAIVGIVAADDILRALGADDAVVAAGTNYFRIFFATSTVVFYLFLINAAFRGAGDASRAMRTLWLANGINLVLDPILIFGLGPFPEMGLTGAAIATSIGRGVGVLYQIGALTFFTHRLAVYGRYLRPDWSILARLARISLGGIFQYVFATASWLFLMSMMARFGSEAVAGYTLAIRILIFTLLPAWGLANAAATLVGQNLGARLPARATQAAWRCSWYNFWFLMLIGVLFIVGGEALIAPFSSDQEVINYGASALAFVAYGYGLLAVGMVLAQALNGAGDTYTPTLINIVAYWLFQLPCAWLLAVIYAWGPRGIFVTILGAEILAALLAIYFFRRGKWQHKVV